MMVDVAKGQDFQRRDTRVLVGCSLHATKSLFLDCRHNLLIHNKATPGIMVSIEEAIDSKHDQLSIPSTWG
ncbi:hypothetical protein [Propioniciclava sp. MC1683]|uniref:hypothetical protein n=1 Tax=Propioniciclava sp. MC1683 TaxID=2760309 RepID=UPI0021041035|nr:hypothetical protein [Propioniciclava sp. MC1683]